MRVINLKSHQRIPSDPKASVEDAIAINRLLSILAAFDGVSPPFSPKNPKENYSPHKGLFLSGGEMLSIIAAEEISKFGPLGLYGRLIEANNRIMEMQRHNHKDPLKEAVAAACFAACQVFQDRIQAYIAGDCFLLFQDEAGKVEYHTNFGPAAQAFEDEGNAEFARQKERAGGNIGKTWDTYIDYFSQKQFFRANRNLGNGGHAVLNGNPAFTRCWTEVVIPAERKPRWVVLGTDGLLPTGFRAEQAYDLGMRYVLDGIDGVLTARDEIAELAHIPRGNHPEASAVMFELAH